MKHTTYILLVMALFALTDLFVRKVAANIETVRYEVTTVEVPCGRDKAPGEIRP